MKKILILIITLSIFGAANATNYERHIYNNSPYNWKFEFEPNEITKLSQRVYIYNHTDDPHQCTDSSNDPVTNGPCTIRSNVTIQFTYDADDADMPDGDLYITDGCGVKKDFTYKVDVLGNIYIYHDGDTGGIYLNDPTPGDISIGGKCF